MRQRGKSLFKLAETRHKTATGSYIERCSETLSKLSQPNALTVEFPGFKMKICSIQQNIATPSFLLKKIKYPFSVYEGKKYQELAKSPTRSYIHNSLEKHKSIH